MKTPPKVLYGLRSCYYCMDLEKTNCPECKHKFKVMLPNESAHTFMVRCPKCGHRFAITNSKQGKRVKKIKVDSYHKRLAHKILNGRKKNPV